MIVFVWSSGLCMIVFVWSSGLCMIVFVWSSGLSVIVVVWSFGLYACACDSGTSCLLSSRAYKKSSQPVVVSLVHSYFQFISYI